MAEEINYKRRNIYINEDIEEEISKEVIRQIIENGLREVNNGLDETLPQYLIEKYTIKDQKLL